MHVLLFGDFRHQRKRRGSGKYTHTLCDLFCECFFLRQLPPATSRAPFIVSPDVINTFDFRVLRQNRRIIKEAGREQELEHFHEVLQSISMGDPTDDVRKFLTEAYVRGAYVGCADNAPLEGSTFISTKRRYRP